MKSLSARIFEYLQREDGHLIALSGHARLVRHLDGRYELRGGTAADRATLRTWCERFFNDALPACDPPPPI